MRQKGVVRENYCTEDCLPYDSKQFTLETCPHNQNDSVNAMQIY